jgi:hypothetical protein
MHDSQDPRFDTGVKYSGLMKIPTGIFKIEKNRNRLDVGIVDIRRIQQFYGSLSEQKKQEKLYRCNLVQFQNIYLVPSGLKMDRIPNRWLVVVPMIVPLGLCCRLIGNPLPVMHHWIKILLHSTRVTDGDDTSAAFMIQQQLMAYLLIAVSGYETTRRLVPHIQQYTLRKNICGKDLGKRGTATADVPMYVHDESFCGVVWV